MKFILIVLSLFSFIFLFVFLLKDSAAKKKCLEKRLRIKDTREIRIDFW